MISNCLFAALIAKIKNPKNVKIIFIPKRFNKQFGCHFVWTENNFVYHFVHTTKSNFSLLYKGKIKKCSKDTFETFMYTKIHHYIYEKEYNILNKYNINIKQRFDWKLVNFDEDVPSYRNGLPFTKSHPYIEVICGKKPNYKTVFIKLYPKKDVVLPKDAKMWRYQTIFNETFNILWFNYKNNEYLKVDSDFID